MTSCPYYLSSTIHSFYQQINKILEFKNYSSQLKKKTELIEQILMLKYSSKIYFKYLLQLIKTHPKYNCSAGLSFCIVYIQD